jgi:hypothetical protein
MASSNWKKVELEHCRELGGERTGPRGYGLPDCIGTPGLALEIKAYKRFTFLTEDWNQAVENAARMKATPALLVREGGRGGRKQVQMRETDFGRWWARSGLRPIRLHRARRRARPRALRLGRLRPALHRLPQQGGGT